MSCLYELDRMEGYANSSGVDMNLFRCSLFPRLYFPSSLLHMPVLGSLEEAPVFPVFFLEHRNRGAHVKGTRTVTLEKSNSHLQQEVVQSLSTHRKAQTGDPGGAPRPRRRNLRPVLEAPIIPGEPEIQQRQATSTHTTHIWLTSPTPN